MSEGSEQQPAEQFNSQELRKLLEQAIIFFIEDEESIRGMSERILEVDGCQNLSVFENSQEALEKLEEIVKKNQPLPHLIITDKDHPGITGIQLLEKVRAMKLETPPPFILISGMIQESDRKRFTEMGFADILPKPFGPKELRRSVWGVLKERFVQDQQTSTTE